MEENIKKGLQEIIELAEKELQSAYDDSWVDWCDYFNNDQYKAQVEAQWESTSKQNENFVSALNYLKTLL